VNDVLSQALEPVLRDIRTSGVPMPEIRDEDWADDPLTATAMLCSPEGSASGLRVDIDAPERDRIAMVADQVQEWVIEELWGHAATNWPPCPNHPDSHPLTASTRDGVAFWICPSDLMPFSPVGSLS
jgi:hypothetical protein